MSSDKKKFWWAWILSCFIIALSTYVVVTHLSNDSILKVIVCVDAPDMLDGPGSVVLVDSTKQPITRKMFTKLARSAISKYIGVNRTMAEPGMPFIYISVTWQSGRRTVITSMNVLANQKQNEVDRLLAESLAILEVNQEDISKALRMAEASEIHDNPIKSYPAP